MAKHRHEAKKAGLPEPESPEASILEGGDLEEPHWLNELLEEEESPVLGVGGPRRGTTGSWGCGQRALNYY